ncbi:MAG: 4'-phosphopantetheinyl transferase superfamily protein [bacterium]
MTGSAVPIDLWLWQLDCDAAEADRRRAVLNDAERARADRFVHNRDRTRFISGRSRLREILSGHVGTSATNLALQLGPNGKPFLPDGPQFNLSHAAGMAALALTVDMSVDLGVDIEGARTVDPGLDAHVFAPDERAALGAVDPSLRDWAFFLGWTRKEAVVKAMGEGLRADLGSFAVTLHPDLPATVSRIDGQTPDDWRLYNFRPRPDLAGAIACRTGGREITVTHRS